MEYGGGRQLPRFFIITEIYDISSFVANTHKTIKTMSFVAYARAKNGLLLYVRNAAIKLVVTENVLGRRFAVLKFFNIK